VERGFYWGTDIEGVPHHRLEEFLTVIEGESAKAFRRVLDAGKVHTDDALPPWPPRADVRNAISWWIAAQILRTLRQRERLDLAPLGSLQLNPPHRLASANPSVPRSSEARSTLQMLILEGELGATSK
jgi:hypothetical protein